MPDKIQTAAPMFFWLKTYLLDFDGNEERFCDEVDYYVKNIESFAVSLPKPWFQDQIDTRYAKLIAC